MTYDPAKDAHDSYFAAIAAKKARGDTHWPQRSSDQKPGLLRSLPKGVSDLCGQYPSCSGVNDSLCGSLPSTSMARPIVGQEQFPGNLHGIDVLYERGASPDGYLNGRVKPIAGHGGASS
jgi:hypothetical protein